MPTTPTPPTDWMMNEAPMTGGDTPVEANTIPTELLDRAADEAQGEDELLGDK